MHLIVPIFKLYYPAYLVVRYAFTIIYFLSW